MGTKRRAQRQAGRRRTCATGPGDALRVVLASAPADAARPLARRLVSRRLAACVNLVPGVECVYRWRGRVETAAETLLVVKTTAIALDRCLAALARAHPYEVPEGLAFTPARALAAYASWVDTCTR
jgi:periplasmic divalent cation tolerance protein